MTKPSISVIIPVYNAKQFLPNCIDSVLGQSFADFELLLIDDGSSDGSGAICDAYEEKDNRVRVFHKENGGASSARNVGLKNSKGEFVVFVDGDDWVENAYLEHLMEDDSDLLVTGLQRHSPSEVVTFTSKRQKVTMDELHEVWNQPEMNYLYCFPVAKRYKNAIIQEHQLSFNEKLFLSEDLCFVLSYLKYAGGLSELPYNDYHYLYHNPDRSSKFKMNAEQIIDHHDFHEQCFDALKEKCHGDFQYIRDNVYLRLMRGFYEYLQDCNNASTYVKNAKLFRRQQWSKHAMGLLKGKRERRVVRSACAFPWLSFMVENKLGKR